MLTVTGLLDIADKQSSFSYPLADFLIQDPVISSIRAYNSEYLATIEKESDIIERFVDNIDAVWSANRHQQKGVHPILTGWLNWKKQTRLIDSTGAFGWRTQLDKIQSIQDILGDSFISVDVNNCVCYLHEDEINDPSVIITKIMNENVH